MKRKITRQGVRLIISMLTGSSGVGKTKMTIPGISLPPEDQGRHSILWIALPYRANRPSLRSFAEAFFTMVDEFIRRKRRP